MCENVGITAHLIGQVAHRGYNRKAIDCSTNTLGCLLLLDPEQS